MAICIDKNMSWVFNLVKSAQFVQMCNVYTTPAQ
jgi:hypothetical protein